MAEEEGGERRTLSEVYGDKESPIVDYKRPKNELNWRERLLALDADMICNVRSMFEELDELGEDDDILILFLFCVWKKVNEEEEEEEENSNMLLMGFMVLLEQM